MSGDNNTLILVDVQNDFHPGGSLAVANADQDAHRIASLIRRSIVSKTNNFSRIICTMDSHNTLHIANPGFWIAGKEYLTNGTMIHPQPFTVITSEEVKSKKWIPRPDMKVMHGKHLNLFGKFHSFHHSNIAFCFHDDRQTIDLDKWCVKYTEMLEQGENHFKLIIWPEHCLVGTEGWCMVKEVRDAVREWEMATGKTAEFICKGSVNLTEMYSAIQAAVPVCSHTTFNDEMFSALAKDSSRIFFCGQASSHCVNFTVRHLVTQLPEDERCKVAILTDCTSPVAGFESVADSFFNDMKAVGVECITSEEIVLD